jgi:hypothetical protein
MADFANVTREGKNVCMMVKGVSGVGKARVAE